MLSYDGERDEAGRWGWGAELKATSVATYTPWARHRSSWICSRLISRRVTWAKRMPSAAVVAVSVSVDAAASWTTRHRTSFCCGDEEDGTPPRTVSECEEAAEDNDTRDDDTRRIDDATAPNDADDVTDCTAKAPR